MLAFVLITHDLFMVLDVLENVFWT